MTPGIGIGIGIGIGFVFLIFFIGGDGKPPQWKKAEKQSQCQCHIPYICRVQNKICRVYTLQKRRTLH